MSMMASVFLCDFLCEKLPKNAFFRFLGKKFFKSIVVKKNWHIVLALILSQNKVAQTSQKGVEYFKKCCIMQSLRRKISFDFDTD